MKIKDYINKFSFDEVWSELKNLYPESGAEAYKHAYDILQSLEASTEPTTMRVVVDHVYDAWEDEPDIDPDDYINVYGKDPNSEVCKDTGMSGEEISWGLSFSPWTDWLSYDVEVITEDERCSSELKVLAHILWEMTFCGYDEEDVEDKLDEIKTIKDKYILDND